MDRATPRAPEPNDRQLFAAGGAPADMWATSRGLEGRINVAGTGKPDYLTVYLLAWDQLARLSSDIAEGRWEPPYVRFAPTPGDEPSWTTDIPGGPRET